VEERSMGKDVGAWLLLSAAAASSATTPREVVETAVQQVIAVLEQSPRGGAEVQPVSGATAPRARLEIRRTAADLFDFEEVGRRALGRHWAIRTPAEQAEFVMLFTDLLERAYVARIEAYSGERVVYTGTAVDGDHAVVRSRILTKRRSTETSLDYRLHRAAGRWRVYDVLIDGVSFVSTYRSQFNRIIQLNSWDELMDRLRKKRLEARPVLDRG
jgi:phospholipid transport system substrate-binding protein